MDKMERLENLKGVVENLRGACALYDKEINANLTNFLNELCHCKYHFKASISIGSCARRDKNEERRCGEYWCGTISIDSNDLSKWGTDFSIYYYATQFELNIGTWGAFNKDCSYVDAQKLCIELFDNMDAIMNYINSIDLTMFDYLYKKRSELESLKYEIESDKYERLTNEATELLKEGFEYVVKTNCRNFFRKIAKVCPKTYKYYSGSVNDNNEVTYYETYSYNEKVVEFLESYRCGHIIPLKDFSFEESE